MKDSSGAFLRAGCFARKKPCNRTTLAIVGPSILPSIPVDDEFLAKIGRGWAFEAFPMALN
tara:strand:+ start:2772 stop:2954 length:183 start_codon:yes stop_codon:yes gene_type:complete